MLAVGFPLSSTEGLEEAAAFQGCVNFMMFRRLLRRLDVGVSEKVSGKAL